MYQSKRINALYCRVSTDGQQTGLESQIRALKDWCIRNQITEYELFADEGTSGAKESRPKVFKILNFLGIKNWGTKESLSLHDLAFTST